MAELIDVRLTLVSSSPRRAELLASRGLSFDIYPSQAAEHWHGAGAGAVAIDNARRKVIRSPLYGDRSRVLLGADTVIKIDDQLLGKPVGPDSARRMLQRLADRSHEVITGLFLSGPAADGTGTGVSVGVFAVSRVRFRALTKASIREYLDAGEWKGKAGAYGIQGLARSFVDELEGDLDNVIGLPLRAIDDLLSKDFVHCRFR